MKQLLHRSCFVPWRSSDESAVAEVRKRKIACSLILVHKVLLGPLAGQGLAIPRLMEVPDAGRYAGHILQLECHLVAQRCLAVEQLAHVLSAHIQPAGKLGAVNVIVFHPLLDEVSGGHDVAGVLGHGRPPRGYGRN